MNFVLFYLILFIFIFESLNFFCFLGLLPIPLASLIFARDFGLILSGFYFRYASLPPPRTLSRYFDFKLPTAEVHPSLISKANTALQLVLMGATISGIPFNSFLKKNQNQ